MAADPATHAFGLALAVLGDHRAAAQVATEAVRLGGRSRTAALAHAHRLAVSAAAALPEPDLGAQVPRELADLAVLLAAGRPAEERAVADLDTRHGLDREQLGRVLGDGPAEAAEAAAQVAASWQEQLDPVLLAVVGTGDCDGLAAVVPGAADVAALLVAAPAVAQHAGGCPPCGDRLRALVSVRGLLGSRPFVVPPVAVQAAARQHRHRRPTWPAPHRSSAGRLPRLVAVAAAALAAVAMGAVVWERGTEPSTEASARGAAAARGTRLEVAPAMLSTRPLTPFQVRNTSDRPVRWRVESGVAWLSARPAEGRLAPGARAEVQLVLASDAPEGEVRRSVAVTSDDGSSAAVRIDTVVERPPDVDASADGCTVTATVEDESDVASVQLHAQTDAGPAQTVAMVQATDGWRATLPADTQRWWVEATDGRHNTGRTAAVDRAPAGC